ncbi:MAG: hypothetical protein R3B69_02080 [Candidatus Paceibacterota bacterium]
MFLLKTAATEDDDTLTTAYTDDTDDSETEVTVEMKSLEDQAHELMYYSPVTPSATYRC